MGRRQTLKRFVGDDLNFCPKRTILHTEPAVDSVAQRWTQEAGRWLSHPVAERSWAAVFSVNHQRLNMKKTMDTAHPHGYTYTLTGDADALKAVQTLMNDLIQHYGIPDNEPLGCFVPHEYLMQVLIGAEGKAMFGNVRHFYDDDPEELVIETESDDGLPLRDALPACFPGLNVQMEEHKMQ